MTRIASLAGLLLLGASVGLSAQTVPKPNRATENVDHSLRQQVRQRLKQYPDLNLVKVKVNQRQVTLRGAVPSYTDRQKAFTIANAVPGTAKVRNQIVTTLDTSQTTVTMGGAAEGGRNRHTERK